MDSNRHYLGKNHLSFILSQKYACVYDPLFSNQKEPMATCSEYTFGKLHTSMPFVFCFYCWRIRVKKKEKTVEGISLWDLIGLTEVVNNKRLHNTTGNYC